MEILARNKLLLSLLLKVKWGEAKDTREEEL